MFRLFYKIFTTPKTVINADDLNCDQAEVSAVGAKIQEKVKKLFRGSLAIRMVDAGSTNAAEQELVALSNAFYDAERFGIHFVASPKHADMLLVTGPVTRNMKNALIKAYEATPDPKIVVALGDDAIDGGIFKGSYAIYDGVKNVIPVDYEISGDPPSPKTILCHLLKILGAIDAKQTKV
ncbi:MAG: hydrogenase [Patescibacteria group bacterium]